ncbi:MAG: homocysteine S-methyltransferase family protein [Polyangiaceae bacterium]|nr:homocysteine S-methyltransferase family protein [Polyangiaceae bacterium]
MPNARPLANIGRVMTPAPAVTWLDGAMGSVLAARGVDTRGPAWSAGALLEAPSKVADLHREYAEAGATVHTACTFRATPEGARALGVARFERLVERAVELARGAVPAHHRVAGSVSPAADCYTPSARPADARQRHARVARALASAGVDLFLCETFVDDVEALLAVEACAAHGRPVWLSLTGGPFGELASTRAVRAVASRALGAGVEAILVNCTAAALTRTYVEALADLPVVIGAYANAGRPEEELGYLADWPGPAPTEAELGRRASRYAELAQTWISAGATLIGGCCGTFPEHLRAVRARVGR